MPLFGSAPGTERAAGSQPAARATDATTARHGRLSLGDAHSLLERLGFLLVPGPPLQPGPAYLLAALRPRPTLAHFDPDRVEYWTVERTILEPAELTWSSPPPNERYGWGAVRVIDRLEAVNSFVSFGGQLQVTRDGGVRVAVLRSTAPILMLREHGGPADALAASVEGFFASLRAAADSDERVGRDAVSLSPDAVYAAYLSATLSRHRTSLAYELADPALLALWRSERRRLRTSSPIAEARGRELAARVCRR